MQISWLWQDMSSVGSGLVEVVTSSLFQRPGPSTRSMCAVAKARQQLGFKNAMQGVQRLAFAISLWLTVPHSTCVVSSASCPYAHVKQIDAAAAYGVQHSRAPCQGMYLYICTSTHMCLEEMYIL